MDSKFKSAESCFSMKSYEAMLMELEMELEMAEIDADYGGDYGMDDISELLFLNITVTQS